MVFKHWSPHITVTTTDIFHIPAYEIQDQQGPWCLSVPSPSTRWSGIQQAGLGVLQAHWMVYFMENPSYRWMISRGSPNDLGKLHAWRSIWDLIARGSPIRHIQAAAAARWKPGKQIGRAKGLAVPARLQATSMLGTLTSCVAGFFFAMSMNGVSTYSWCAMGWSSKQEGKV